MSANQLLPSNCNFFSPIPPNHLLPKIKTITTTTTTTTTITTASRKKKN